MAAMQRTFSALRQAVLSHVRIPASSSSLTQSVSAPVSLQFLRGFADASYLDKKEVTDRVLNVVKNFEKVDAAKVSGCVEAYTPLLCHTNCCRSGRAVGWVQPPSPPQQVVDPTGL